MSPFLKLTTADFWSGLIIAIISSIVAGVLAIVKLGRLPTGGEWITIGITALSAMLAYLVKNILSNSKGEFLKPER